MWCAQVWDSDFASQDQEMGTVSIPLDKLTADMDETVELELVLQHQAGADATTGALHVRLEWREDHGQVLEDGSGRQMSCFERVVMSGPAGTAVDCCIMFNFLMMAAEHHGMDDGWSDAFEVISP